MELKKIQFRENANKTNVRSPPTVIMVPLVTTSSES